MDRGFQRYLKTLQKSGVIKTSENVGCLGMYRFILEDVITGKKEVQYYHNIVPTVGLTLFANNLTAAVPTNAMKVNYAALGTNVTAPVPADTQLGTETYRNAIASTTNSATGIAYATAYFNQTETTGTYKEAGIFSAATGAANSGVLVSHVAINVTKTNVQKLTVDWTLTFTSI